MSQTSHPFFGRIAAGIRLDEIPARYVQLLSQGGFEIYRHRPDTSIYRPQVGATP